MAILVEHEKRKKEILEKALDVFEKEGFEDATFQKIADKCGITRTTLYIYFKNKHEIFLFSIKQLLGQMEVGLVELINNPNLSYEEILKTTMLRLIDYCEENKQLFNILLPYLMQIKKEGDSPYDKIRRRIVKLRHLLSTIVITGIQNKEFKQENVKNINELLYSTLEAAMFQIAILDKDCKDLKASVLYTIDNLLISKK